MKSLSRVWLFATLWTVGHPAPLSMGFPRQEYWSGVPSPSPFNLNTCTKYTWPLLKLKNRKQNLHRNSQPCPPSRNSSLMWARNLASQVVHGKESTCKEGDSGSIPGSRRTPGGEHGNPLQYSCLGNPMDRGAWWATVHGVTKSQSRLSTHKTKSWSQH